MNRSFTMRAAAAATALVALLTASSTVAAPQPGFDLEGHRGTRGLRPENTLAAFGKALQVGVTTLELDTGVTKDGVVVVSHERRISPLECQDTDGNHVVGQLIRELTYAQIQTLDCGTRNPPNPATPSARIQSGPAAIDRIFGLLDPGTCSELGSAAQA